MVSCTGDIFYAISPYILLNIDTNSTDACPWWPKRQQVTTVSAEGSVSNRQQAIACTNDVLWRHVTSQGHIS